MSKKKVLKKLMVAPPAEEYRFSVTDDLLGTPLIYVGDISPNPQFVWIDDAGTTH